MKKNFHPELPLDKKCQILDYDASGIFAINKAPGVLSHPNPNFKGKSHSLLLAKYKQEHECYEWKDQASKTNKLYLCHRLDSPTSGIIIGTSTHDLALLIKKKFSSREIQKTYLAITQYNPQAKEGIWTDHLVEEKIEGRLRVVRGNGPKCQAKVRFIQTKKGENALQLIELKPLTGRTHQLRVQCMLRKMPILGDKTYGNFSLNRKVKKESKLERLCLHASEIRFSIKHNNEKIDFYCESPLPRTLGKILS